MKSGSYALRDRLAVGGALVFGAAWLAWRIAFSLSGISGWLSWPLVAVEGYALLRLALMALKSSSHDGRSAQAGDVSVDIGVIVAGHEAAVVRAAVIGATAVKNSAGTALAAPDRAEYRAIAEEFGARFVPTTGTWESGVNELVASSTSGAIALLSAQTAALSDLVSIARAELGNGVGYVQSQMLLPSERTPLQSVQNDVYGPNASASGVAPWLGNGSIIRVEAFSDVVVSPKGAFATTIELQGKDWAGAWSVTPIGAPQLPTSANDIRKARTRQTAERLRVVRTRNNPLIARGLTARARIHHFGTVLDDLGGVAAAVVVAVVVGSLMSGRLPIHTNWQMFALLGIPSVLLANVARVAMTRGRIQPLSMSHLNIEQMDISVGALLKSMAPTPEVGKIAGLSEAGDLGGIQMLSVRPVGAFAAVALNVALLTRAGSAIFHVGLARAARSTELLTLALGLVTLVPMLRGLQVLVRTRQLRAARRVDVSLAARLGNATTHVRDLSPFGAGVVTQGSFSVGDTAPLSFALPGRSTPATLDAVVRSVAQLSNGTSRIGVSLSASDRSAHDDLTKYWATTWATKAARVTEEAAVTTFAARGAFRVNSGANRVVRFVSAFSLLATGMAALPPYNPASAAVGPNLTFTKDAPATVLYGNTATNTLKACNGIGAQTVYNASFHDVLPAGVTYVSGTPAPELILSNKPAAGQTTLIWSNVNDIQPGSCTSVSYVVKHDTSEVANSPTYVGLSYVNSADVYTNTDPRYIPKFDGNGAYTTGSTNQASSTATTKIIPIILTKVEPSPEAELVRGVHNHETTYTLTLTNNKIKATNNTVVDDYIPAAMEFLGCGTADHSASGYAEYPGAGRLDVTTTDLSAPDCLAPVLVETVQNPAGYAPGIYTHIRWNSGNMAAGAVKKITYQAAIPNRENVMFAAPVPNINCGAAADSCAQVANLDNNTGPLTYEPGGENTITNKATVGGTYTGLLPSGVPATQTWDTTQYTVFVEDLAIQKSACNADQPNPQNPSAGSCLNGVQYGGITTWTLNIETSEYRKSDKIVVTDKIPDGLDYVDGSSKIVSGVNTVSPFEPTANSGSGGSNPIQTIAWDFPTLLAGKSITPTMNVDAVYSIAFQTKTRTDYRATGKPVLSFDGITNNVAMTGTSTVVKGDDNAGAKDIQDVSSASISSAWSKISKKVLSGAGLPAIGGKQCSSGITNPAGGGATSGIPRFAPYDVVCYDLVVEFPSGIKVKNALISDFIPPNTSYLAYATQPDHNDTESYILPPVPAVPGAEVPVQWAFGTPSGATPRYTKQIGSKFHVIIATRVTDDPNLNNNYDITANLLKATGQDTNDNAVSLRASDTFMVAEPELQLVKGIVDIKRGAPLASISGYPKAAPAAGNDGHTGVQNDVVTYQLNVPNVGPQFLDANNKPKLMGNTSDQITDAFSVTIWDKLPAGLTCSEVSSLPATATLAVRSGGTALAVAPSVTLTSAPVCAADIIKFTADHIPAGYQLQYKYDLKIRDDAPAGKNYYNIAGVRDYNDLGSKGAAPGAAGSAVYYPANNIDATVKATNSPQAIDDANITIPSASITKTRSTSIAESNNAATDQATIGEHVLYTVTFTVPAHTSIYDGVVSDTLPGNVKYVVSSAVGAVVSAKPAAAPAWVIADVGNGWKLSMPTSYQNADDVDHVFKVTFDSIVLDSASNTHSVIFANKATLKWNDKVGGTALGNKSASVNTTVVEPAPSIAKSHSPAGPFGGGDLVSYTLTISNASGRPPLHDAIVTDCVPVGLTGVTPAQVTAPRTVTVDTGAPCAAGLTRVVWNLADLESRDPVNPGKGLQGGESISLTYVAKLIDPAVGASDLVNNAKVNGTSITGDDKGERTTYEAKTTDKITVKVPSISKSVAQTTLVPGQVADYTLKVTIPGNTRLYDSTVIDQLPANMAFESYGSYGFPANFVGDCKADAAQTHTITQAGQSAGWFIGDIVVGAKECVMTVTYKAHVRSAAVDGDNLKNVATLYWNITDEIKDKTDLTIAGFDKSLAVEANVKVIEPKLTITKAVNDADKIVEGGQGLTYTITIGNSGNADAFDIAVSDVLPTGLGTPSNIGGTCVNSTSGVYAAGTKTISWDQLFNGSVGLKPASSCTLTYDEPVDPAHPITWKDGAALTNTVAIDKFFGDPDHSANKDFKTYTGPKAQESVKAYRPNLAIVKTTGNGTDLDTAEIGKAFAWKLHITNDASYATAYGVTVVDTLPKNWTFNAVTNVTATKASNPSSCNVSPTASNTNPQTITWSKMCDLGPGGVIDVTFNATPGTDAATDPGLVDKEGTKIKHVNVATVNGTDKGGSKLPEVKDDAKAEIKSVDLQIIKTDASKDNDGSPESAGFTVGVAGYYYMDVKNNGPDTETGPITVTDTMPTGLTASAVIGKGWKCTVAPGGAAFTCVADGPLKSGVNLPRITLTVDVGVKALNIDANTGLVTNIASVKGVDTDRNPKNNTDPEPTPVVRLSDFTIDKALEADTSFVPGTQVKYIIKVANLGPSPATGPLTVTDPLPDRLRFISASGTGWDCSASKPSSAGPIPGTASAAGAGYQAKPDNNGSVSCTRNVTDLGVSTLDATNLPSITVVAEIDPGTPAEPPVLNVATVSHPNDKNPSNDTNDEKANPKPTTTLTIDKSDGDATFKVGQTDAKYYVVVSNKGPSVEAGPVVVTDTPPDNLKLLAADGGENWRCEVKVGTGFTVADNGTLTCTWIGKQVDPGMTLDQIVITVEVGPGAISDSRPGATNIVTNSATVTGVTDPKSHTDPEPTPVIPKAALTIDKHHDEKTEPWVVGQKGTFLVTVGNTGPSGEYGPIIVNDELPVGVTFDSAKGDGWVCQLLTGVGLGVNGTVKCIADRPVTLDAKTAMLAAGDKLTDITIVVNVTPDAAPKVWPSTNTIENTADVHGATDPDKHSDTDKVPVLPIADLQIIKTHVGDTFQVGDLGTFTLTIKNNGPNLAAGKIVVTDPLPSGLTYDSATGTGWTCSSDVNKLIVTCDHADQMKAGEESAITLKVNVLPAAYASEGHIIVNTATVKTPTKDPEPKNDTSTDKVPSKPLVDLTITKTHVGDFTVGLPGTFTVTVTNLGPNPHPDDPITVVDTLPVGLTFVSAAGDGWKCTNAAAVVTCIHAGPLLKDASLPVITLVVKTGPEAEGGVINKAHVSTSVKESKTTNNDASDPIKIVPVANLVLTKTLLGALVVGATAQWELTLKNEGPSPAENPSVTDPMPPELEAVSAVGDGFACTVVPGYVNCVRSTPLAAGATTKIVVTTKVIKSNGKNIINTASVSTPTPETTVVDNTAAAQGEPTEVKAATNTNQLPRTGANTLGLLTMAVAFMAGGFLLVGTSRRRRHDDDDDEALA